MLKQFMQECLLREEACNGYSMKHYHTLLPLVQQLEHEAGEKFTSIFQPFELEAKSFLLRENEISDRIWLLNSGYARVYRCLNDKEITNNFFFPGEFIDRYSSSSLNEPAHINIQLLEKASGWFVLWSDINALKKEFPLVTDLQEKITACYTKSLEEREFRLLSTRTKEHYLFLIQHYPNYIREIEGQHIAAYLGISPGSLSRIKGEL